jgi:hypothetical protein
MPDYNSITVGYPYIIRGTNQQTDTGLIYQPPTYKSFGAGAVAAATNSCGGIRVGGISLQNRSAASVVVGYGVRIPNYLWKAGQWVDATTTYTDDTTAAQDTTTDDFPLETTTNNDGFVILSRVKFNAVSVNVSTASVDGTPVRATRFSDAAGTSWQTAENNLFIPPTTGAVYALGELPILFAPPADWGLSSSLATGLPNGYYAMNVRSTTAPTTTAAIAKAIEIFYVHMPVEALADNAIYEYWNQPEVVFPVEGDALVAVFSTANDQNRVTTNVRSAG